MALAPPNPAQPPIPQPLRDLDALVVVCRLLKQRVENLTAALTAATARIDALERRA